MFDIKEPKELMHSIQYYMYNGVEVVNAVCQIFVTLEFNIVF